MLASLEWHGLLNSQILPLYFFFNLSCTDKEFYMSLTHPEFFAERNIFEQEYALNENGLSCLNT